jgi:hypothetical protein
MKEQERGGEHSRNQSLSKSLLLKSIQKNNKQTSRYSLLYIHFRRLFQARQKPKGMAKPTKHQSSKQSTGGKMPPAKKQSKERRRKSHRNRNKTNKKTRKKERKKRNNAHILRVTGSTMAGVQAVRRRLTSQA